MEVILRPLRLFFLVFPDPFHPPLFTFPDVATFPPSISRSPSLSTATHAFRVFREFLILARGF